MKTKKLNIDLSAVRKSCIKIVCVEEFYLPGLKWTHILDDNNLCTDADLYKDGVEGVVKMCIDAGATMIQFRVRDFNRHLIHPEYIVTDLVKQ